MKFKIILENLAEQLHVPLRFVFVHNFVHDNPNLYVMKHQQPYIYIFKPPQAMHLVENV